MWERFIRHTVVMKVANGDHVKLKGYVRIAVSIAGVTRFCRFSLSKWLGSQQTGNADK